ncbi:MAG TPA: PIG-L deacetylase family protein [Rhodothermales bacterium]
MERPLNIIAFGAHPDDCELKVGGCAARWSRQGHRVKFVATTNGDIGHFSMAGGPLARRRRAEVERCAEILGIETQVLDIHDGELVPSLENRKIIAGLIREWQADVVLTHRPWDYHADHRYTATLVQDAAVLVTAEYFTPYTPAVRTPVILYMSDDFKKPYPFQPDFVVGIDGTAELKWDCIRAMPSQFADPDSWIARYVEGVPSDDALRADYILDLFRHEDASIADRYRERLIDRLGEQQAREVRYAEAFELCEYGRVPTEEEVGALFS